jgi:hypothetical protein
LSSDGKGKDKERHHRLSRKKRRRLEALEAAEGAGDDGDNGGDALGKSASLNRLRCVVYETYLCRCLNSFLYSGSTGKVEPSVKTMAKRSKVAHRNQAEERKDKSLAELDAKKGKKKLSDGRTKIMRPKFAIGGIDQDMSEWGEGGGSVSKKLLKKDARQKEFTDFDPEKRLRKGGKVGKSSFKSKAKFKRRK